MQIHKSGIFQVERVSYYDYPKSDQTLRYAEVAPPEEHKHEGAVCGCTKSVLEKPEGIPSHRVQEFHFLSDGFDFPLVRGQITFGQLGDPKGHAYFWYRLHRGETSIQVEITLPGYGSVDHFFATLMKGNAIDGRHLFNGHSPSRIFDPSKVDPDAIYLHGSRGWKGKEAIRFFQTPEEIALWNETFRLVSIVQGQVAYLSEDYETPVEALRVLLEADPVLREAALATRELLAPVAAQLPETELFRLGDEIYQECKS